MRKRDIERFLTGDVPDTESLYELSDESGAPGQARMRRNRNGEPGPRSRGRLTEEARARLVQERKAVAVDDRPPQGDRWSSWGDAEEVGPRPHPSWVVTALAAVDTELGVIKTGKEADVFLVERAVPGDDRSCLMAAKRYRAGDHRLFHRDATYLEGRRVRDSREMRAMRRRSDFGRNLIAQQWAIAEFAALRQLWAIGAPVPYPVQRIGTELLLEFIGDADGTAAPRLVELRPSQDQLADLWQQLIEAMVTLARRGRRRGRSRGGGRAAAPRGWPGMSGSGPAFRRAGRQDVPAIVRLLADDQLGRTREVTGAGPEDLPASYWEAFEAIDADPRNLLVVAELQGQVVGTLQLTFIPSLTLVGGERAQIEAVRVDGHYRGQGLGGAMLRWAIEQARARGCRLVQLTTDKRRPDALRLYRSLGFQATHEGLKLRLNDP